MAASLTNTDVIVDHTSTDVPSCPHGPALLFERYTKAKDSRKFYACSAFRDRKLCSFFRWADEVKGRKKGDDPHAAGGADVGSSEGSGQPLSHWACRKRFLQFKKQPLSQRSLCVTCGLLLLGEEVKEHEAKGHPIKHGVRKAALQRPTSLFEPLEDNKAYAQYLFTDPVVKFVVNCLEENNKTHFLCVGTPRLHEAVSVMRKAGHTQLTSLLMDLDWRYGQVYPPKSFCRYNMLNHHFLEAGGEERFRSFVGEAGRGLVVMADPPFGAMVEALVASFRKVQHTWNTLTHTEGGVAMVWFFPYFLEKRLTQTWPALTMLDYKVDYDNHTLFHSHHSHCRHKKKNKKGSPVRIFTTLHPLSFPLPSSEGYWLCTVCQRYSAAENKHCLQCNSCTSKDGTPYRHCAACQRCVKATRVHCDTCQVCDLPQHTCGQPRGQGCHICGALDHKRRDCPQQHNPRPRSSGGKRPAAQATARPKKKTRKK